MTVPIRTAKAKIGTTLKSVKPCSTAGYIPLTRIELAAQQAVLTRRQLCKRQIELTGPSGLFSRFSVQVAEQGRQAPFLQVVLDADPAKPAGMTESAIEFALACHHRRAYAGNPFANWSRDELCCVIYDESRPSNVAERYAAHEELKASDSRYFIKLIATTYNTVERRLVFQGLLEHFDSLLPVEQSIYQDGYREVQQGYLEREQELYGPLRLNRTLSAIFAEQTPQSLLASLAPSG